MEKEPRAEQIGQLNTQLDNLEKLVVGPYVVGEELTTADGSLLPNLCWLNYILPQFFGWDDVFKNRPKLAACWETIQKDDAAAKVCSCRDGGLCACCKTLHELRLNMPQKCPRQ